jgi:hypothetical protein
LKGRRLSDFPINRAEIMKNMSVFKRQPRISLKEGLRTCGISFKERLRGERNEDIDVK